MYGLQVGQVLRRTEVHERFGGQRQGGIATPSGRPVVLIFTGKGGLSNGYEDGWQEDVFNYFGEGQIGDMVFTRGNRAIRDHLQDGRDLLLFTMLGGGQVRFEGPFIAGSWDYAQGRDRNNADRRAIVFHLRRGVDPEAIEDPLGGAPDRALVDLAELRRRAVADGRAAPQRRDAAARSYVERSQSVRSYALARAAGRCECCGAAAPFEDSRGQPFLEVHHLHRLTDGGPDLPDRVAAICPNCHRKVHHAARHEAANLDLARRIGERETEIAAQMAAGAVMRAGA